MNKMFVICLYGFYSGCRIDLWQMYADKEHNVAADTS